MSSLTDLDRLRLMVSDRERAILNQQIGEGDGATVDFQTAVSPVVSESDSVWVGGVLQVRDTDYTIALDLGVVTFAAAPASGAVITCSYRWTTFTDDELLDVMDRHGAVRLAAIEVIGWLLASRDLFLKYTFGQESVDRSATKDSLSRLLDELRSGAGGFIGLVMATTPDRERLLEPFVDQDEDLVDVT